MALDTFHYVQHPDRLSPTGLAGEKIGPTTATLPGATVCNVSAQ